MACPLLFLALFLARPLGSWGQGDAPMLLFSEYLDQEQNISLRWGFDRVQNNITFQLSVKTLGWVGFGFSPNGGMDGSDIVIGGVGPNGTYFTDRHVVGNSLPLVDNQQSYTLLSLTEADGRTVMTFRRAIQSCDPQDYSISDGPVNLIYTFGKTDNERFNATPMGEKAVNLLDYIPQTHVTNSSYFDFMLTNFTVPAIPTHSQCKVMSAPPLDRKYHIYRIEPIIDHLSLVYRMLLYHCPAQVNHTYEMECNLPGSVEDCTQVMSVWGVGAGVFELPERAGIPFGGESSPAFYRLEIYYNNPTLEKGCVDNSGLRVVYTDQLRLHDAGILYTGMLVDSNYMIPPNAKNFHSYGLCDTSLFPQILLNSIPDLQVFALLPHTHLAGQMVRIGHIRNGKQVEFIGLFENVNLEMQSITTLGNMKTVKAGDMILVECTYNTVNRTGLTRLGIGVKDEKCEVFLYYYPAINISNCQSFLNPQAFTGLSDQPGNWTNDTVREYEFKLKNLPQTVVAINIDNQCAADPNGMIYDLMDTPYVGCRMNPSTGSHFMGTGSNASNNEGSSSKVTTLTKSVLLLSWMAVHFAL